MSCGGRASRISRLLPTNTVFLQCDIQTKFEHIIHKMPIIVKNTARMARVARILKIPLIVTEQTPKKSRIYFRWN